LDDHNGAQHGRAQPIKPNEDQPIDERQSRPRWHPAAQDVQLMPKNDDLSFKPSRGPEQRDHEACEELQTIDHPAADYPIGGRKPLRIKFSVGTKPVILAFYPADWSPVCGDQMTLYNEVRSEFQKHEATLLGISVAISRHHRPTPRLVAGRRPVTSSADRSVLPHICEIA
jgi:hypothetical protein